MSWKDIIKNDTPLLIPKEPLVTLRDSLSEPIPVAALDNLKFLDTLTMGIEIILSLAEHYNIPHPFDREKIQDLFVEYDFLDEGPLVLQEDRFMIDERLDDIYYKISKEEMIGTSARSNEFYTFKRN